MATVTISEAARLAGISRTQLYRGFINKGKLSVIKENNKVAIDVSELLRVFPNATIEEQLPQQKVAERNSENTVGQAEVVTLLKDQLKKAEAQLAEAQERENWLKQQIDELRHHQNHLLEDKRVKPRKKFLGIF